MWRENFLDPIVARLRHRWATDSQYRAAMSGVLALALLLGMCTCMGVVSAAANGALSGSGLSGGLGPLGATSGTPGSLLGVPSFPTATIKGWDVPPTPISSPVPTSLTPQPSPTNPPTPTVQPTSTACSSCATVVNHQETPSPWIHCGNSNLTCDSINITTDRPNADVTILITFPNTSITSVNGQITTDGSGYGTFSFTIGPPNVSGRAHVTLTASGGSIQYRVQYL